MKLKTASAIAFPLATCVTLAAVVLTAVNARGRNGWEKYVAEARDRGVKMSLQDFLPPPVPDAENFAAVPLFERVFSEDKAAREKAQQALSLPVTTDGKPRVASLSDARLIDLAEWQAAFVQSKDLPVSGADPAFDILQALEHRCGPALADLAEAERRPRSRFPVKWERGFAALLPHLQLFPAAAKIHQLRLAAHLTRHEVAPAYQEFQGALRDFHALDDEPVLISLLVRIASLNATLSGVWEGVVRDQWDDAALERIDANLATLNLLADYHRSLGAERGFMNDVFAQLRRADPATREMLQAAQKSEGAEATSAYMIHVPGYLHFNQIMLNRYYDGRLAAIDPVGMQIKSLPADAPDPKTMREQASFLERTFFSLVYLTAPALEKVEQNCLHAQTMVDLTSVACALERFRHANGEYPETLEALVPKYLPALPHDIVNSAPLHYRRTHDGHFTLYSVGMNRNDDGGTTGGKPNASEHADWVWRWPETNAR